MMMPSIQRKMQKEKQTHTVKGLGKMDLLETEKRWILELQVGKLGEIRGKTATSALFKFWFNRCPSSILTSLRQNTSPFVSLIVYLENQFLKQPSW